MCKRAVEAGKEVESAAVLCLGDACVTMHGLDTPGGYSACMDNKYAHKTWEGILSHASETGTRLQGRRIAHIFRRRRGGGVAARGSACDRRGAVARLSARRRTTHRGGRRGEETQVGAHVPRNNRTSPPTPSMEAPAPAAAAPSSAASAPRRVAVMGGTGATGKAGAPSSSHSPCATIFSPPRSG